MSAARRTYRDRQRRRLGQNFLRAATAERIVDQAGFRRGDLVLEIGAGKGAITSALARRDVRVLAVEIDARWSEKLRDQFSGNPGIRVLQGDFLSIALPEEPFRVIGSLPFRRTTDILRRLLDHPESGLIRADLIVQWEVAKKRSATPPNNLVSTAWAPWWRVRLATRIPARDFRPVPRVDGGLLEITRREPPLLPTSMAENYARFVRDNWPFV